jgi:hypothetical protein
MDVSLFFSVGSCNIYIISFIKILHVFLQWSEKKIQTLFLSLIIVVSFTEQSKLMTTDEIPPLCNCKGPLTDKK